MTTLHPAVRAAAEAHYAREAAARYERSADAYEAAGATLLAAADRERAAEWIRTAERKEARWGIAPGTDPLHMVDLVVEPGWTLGRPA